MPNTIIDKDGNEVQVPTQEEIDQLAQERADAAAKEAEEKAKAEADALLAQKDAEIERLQGKDRDWRTVRNKIEKKSEAEEQHEKDIADLKTKLAAMERQPFESAKSEFLAANGKALAEKDVKDKFDFFYGKLADGVTNPADHERALLAALTAATGGTAQPVGPRVIATSSNIPLGESHAESETSRDIGRDLGLSEEDKKLYGKPLPADRLW